MADSKIGIVKNYYAEERWKKSTAAGMKKQEDNRYKNYLKRLSGGQPLFFFGKEYHCMDDFMWAIYTTSVGLAVTIYGKV